MFSFLRNLVMSTPRVQLFVVGQLFMSCSGCFDSHHRPSDAQVRSLFANRRNDFETVLDMVQTDHLSALQLSPDGPMIHISAGDWRQLSGTCSPREEQYIALLSGMSVTRVDRGWGRPDDDIAFTVYAQGSLSDSYTKRVVYTKKEPQPLRSDTDTPEFDRDNSRVYASLGDDWYIEKERD